MEIEAKVDTDYIGNAASSIARPFYSLGEREKALE